MLRCKLSLPAPVCMVIFFKQKVIGFSPAFLADYTISNKHDLKMINKMNDEKGKILLATLAGIGAGVVAGMLLAPSNGVEARDSIKKTLTKVGDDLERTVKNLMDKLESNKLTDDGSSLIMRGSWDDVKGQLKKNYAELTEDDLTYVEGQEDELWGRLQQKLGKTKNEIMKVIRGI